MIQICLSGWGGARQAGLRHAYSFEIPDSISLDQKRGRVGSTGTTSPQQPKPAVPVHDGAFRRAT